MNFKMVALGDYLKGGGSGVFFGHSVKKRRNGRMVIDCAYCRKTGFDYDGISICPVCRGKKRILIKEPAVMCAFCKSRGSSNGKATVCRVCHGKGFVTMENPMEKCPECRGRGRITGTDLMCIKCGGKGVVEINRNY